MSKSFKVDLTGQRFGRLTVVEFVPNKKRHSYWKCICDCGNITVVRLGDLRTGDTTSCGCKKIERAKLMNDEYIKKHNLSSNRIFTILKNMKARCYYSKDKNYKNYGARGIKICEEWKNDVKAFYDWAMANGYRDDLSIDRIDVNGNYEPNNCRWISPLEQQRNKTNTIFVEYGGKLRSISEVAEITGIKKATISDRYHKGDRGDNLFRSVEKK